MKDGSNLLSLPGMDLQSAAGIHFISQDRCATHPFAFAPGRPHLIPGPLRDQLPLKLRKR
jgi:hypothetical protein